MFKKIYIEIINYCNLNCPFCEKTKREKKMISFDEFKHILNEIKGYTDYIYLHIQGEPLLHKDINLFIDYAYNLGFKVNVTTNATLLQNLSTKNIRQLNISLQALLNKIDKEKYLENICNYIDSNDNTYISLRLWGNYEKNEMLEYFNKRYNRSCNLTDNNKLKSRVFFSNSDEFTWPSLELDSSFHSRCLGTITHVGILASGDVVPCCLDKDGIITLGNIYKSSFKEIISSDRYKTIRNGFINNKCTEVLCQKCLYKGRFK